MPPRANTSIELHRWVMMLVNAVDNGLNKAFTGRLAAQTTRRMIVSIGKSFLFGIVFDAGALLGRACCWPCPGFPLARSVVARSTTSPTSPWAGLFGGLRGAASGVEAPRRESRTATGALRVQLALPQRHYYRQRKKQRSDRNHKPRRLFWRRVRMPIALNHTSVYRSFCCRCGETWTLVDLLRA